MCRAGYCFDKASVNGSARPVQPGQPILKSSSSGRPRNASRAGAVSPVRAVTCQTGAGSLIIAQKPCGYKAIYLSKGKDPGEVDRYSISA